MLITTELNKDMKDVIGKNVRSQAGELIGEVIFYDAPTGKTIIDVTSEYWNGIGSNQKLEISSRGSN